MKAQSGAVATQMASDAGRVSGNWDSADGERGFGGSVDADEPVQKMQWTPQITMP